MEARGYDPNKERTRYKVLKMTMLDYVGLAASFFVLLVCIGIGVLL